jgi:predicted ester cyclase
VLHSCEATRFRNDLVMLSQRLVCMLSVVGGTRHQTGDLFTDWIVPAFSIIVQFECAHPQARPYMSSPGFKPLAQHVVERAFNKGELDGLSELYSSAILYHRPPLADISGLEPLQEYIANLLRTFSEIRYRVEGIALGDETLTIRWTLRGSHTGQSSAMPVPPTRKEVAITGCSIAQCVEGKVEEEWCYVDWLGLFQQLNVIPPIS